VPGVQAAVHVDATHSSPGLHGRLHAPQFFGSDDRDTQTPPQSANPLVHEHVPAVHVRDVPQALSHAPQWAALVATSTHEPSHNEPWPQAHAPFVQTAPGTQTVPQAPQFWGSVVRSVQAAPHVVNPEAQLVAHRPPAQTCPGAQGAPQAPQLAASLPMFTHRPLQSVVPTGQTQAPDEHCFAPLQDAPHAPQFCESLERSTQAPVHTLSGAGQAALHEPAWHTVPELQTVEHPPQ
jgi:hypothetical protein